MLATRPSTVMILACSIDGWNVPELDAAVEQARRTSLRSASCTKRLSACGPGRRISTSTPRSAASHEPVRDLVVGHEVGGRDAHAALGELQQRAEQGVDVAPSGLRRAAHALDHRRRPAWVGRGSGRCPSSKSSGSVSVQLSRNAARSPSTAGPWMRKCVSRHSRRVPRVAAPLVGDADAAGEADRLVDDHHLAVRAVVHLPEPEPVRAAGTSARCTPAASMHRR